jgi:hypothetical protein
MSTIPLQAENQDPDVGEENRPTGEGLQVLSLHPLAPGWENPPVEHRSGGLSSPPPPAGCPPFMVALTMVAQRRAKCEST